MIPELVLEGAPQQRGQAHGEALRENVAEAMELWFATLAPRCSPADFVVEVTNAGFLEVAERLTPEFVAEVRGIAEGANQTFETMFAWQLIDECWWYLDEKTGDRSAHEACSAMAINDGTRGIVAQTQDLYRNFDGSQVLLRYIDEDGLEIITPSAAGLLAYNGVNSAGLAMCITTLSQLGTQTSGLSTGFVVPALLRHRTIDSALEWLNNTPVAGGNSWTLGTAERSVVVEASPAGVDVVSDGQVALHTNHVLAQAPTHEYVRFENSITRLEQLNNTVTPTMSVADVEAMYTTAPVCQSRSGSGDVISVVTTIIELGETIALHTAPGPLDTEPLTTYTLSSTR